MMRIFLVAFSTLLLLTVHLAFAGMDCQGEFDACNGRITVVNDIEVNEAKVACKRDYRDCKMKIEESESNPPQQEESEKTPEEQQEKAKVEPQKNDNAEGMKTYQFDK